MARIGTNRSDWHTGHAPRRYIAGYDEANDYGFIDYAVSGTSVTINAKIEDFSGVSYSSNPAYADGYLADTMRIIIEDSNESLSEWASYTLVLHTNGSPRRYFTTDEDLGTLIAGTTKTLNPGSYKIYIYMSCSDGSACPDDVGDTSAHPYGMQCCGPYSFDVAEPYVKPSISISEHKTLGVYNKSNDFKEVYTITAGSKSILFAGLEVYDSDCRNRLDTNQYNNISKNTGSAQTYYYNLNLPNCGNGRHYKIRLYIQDGESTEYTSWKDIYTCHEPSVSDLNLWTDGTDSASKISSFSPQNTTVEFWWTQNGNTKNTERWTDQGEVEKTNELYTYTDDVKHSLNPGNNNRRLAMTKDNINKLFPTNERNTVALKKKVYISRTQSQIGIEGRTTKTAYTNITLQLQPNNSFDGFKICNSSGTDITNTIQNQIVSKNDYSTVILKWSYDTTAIASGVVSGYKIDLYSDANCTNLIKNLGSVQTNQYTLNVKDDCRSLILNYIKITPYYKYDNNNIYNGTSPLKKSLFIPYGEIKKPVIEYPVNNTIWHNRNFRVLFKLSEDEDYDNSQANTYRYTDIELNILGKSNLISQPYTYKWSEYSFMYSTNTLSYQKQIVINPSLTFSSGNLTLGGLANFSQYKIKVRVGKTVNNKVVWSAWSDEITLNKSDLVPLEVDGEDYLAIYQELNEILSEDDSYSGTGDTNINIYNELNTILNETDPYDGGGQGDIIVGGIIRAEHYNIIRNYSERLRSVYSPLATEDIENIQVEIGDIINHEKYLKIYNTVKRIQSSVNNYAEFDKDRDNVKFNQTINLLDEPNNQPRGDGEIITAERDLRPGSGRDYLLLLYDSMSLLY